jgi:hypothetical protein
LGLHFDPRLPDCQHFFLHLSLHAGNLFLHFYIPLDPYAFLLLVELPLLVYERLLHGVTHLVLRLV